MAGSINSDIYPEHGENEEVYNEDCEIRELVDNTPCLKTTNEPVDHYKLVYFLFYLYGITSLMPWNFFVTANDVSYL